jgi:hypothetical protein
LLKREQQNFFCFHQVLVASAYQAASIKKFDITPTNHKGLATLAFLLADFVRLKKIGPIC